LIEQNNNDEYLFVASKEYSSHGLNIWLIWRNCTHHMTNVYFIFSSIDRSIQPTVKLGNGKFVQAKGKRTTFISTKNCMITVTNVL